MADVDVPTKTTDDYALMEAIAAGDDVALSAFYDRHSGLVFTLCLRVLRDRMEAEDVLTEVFWELWSKSDRYDAARGTPLTYLLTLARSRAIDRRRSGGKRRSLQAAGDTLGTAGADADQRSTAVTPLQDAVAKEFRAKVLQAMARLDPAQRQAVELSFFDDLSHSQIAEQLNKPLGTVKTYIRQGLIRLRESLRMD